MDGDHPGFAAALAALEAGNVEELRLLLNASPDRVRARAKTAEPPYDGRPVDWAHHCGHGDVVEILRRDL